MSITRTVMFVVVWSCGILVASAGGIEIAWVPLESDGGHNIVGHEIVLAGGGQLVTLELRLSEWDPDQDGNPKLGTYQVTVDSTGYSSGAGDPLTPLVVPTPLEGVYQMLKMCHEFVPPSYFLPTGGRCDSPLTCPGGEFCFANPYFVFNGILNQAAVSTVSLNYSWGATTNAGQCKEDEGLCSRVGGDVCAVDSDCTLYPDEECIWSYYGGTLILDVPAAARGTYTIGFDPYSANTFVNDCSGIALGGLVFVPGQITIACQNNSDCDDGNACTNDVCGLDERCSNELNYDPEVDCCNPASGDLTPLEDGNDCTYGVCNPDDGSVIQLPYPLWTPCGEPPACECDEPDYCDGNGTCLEIYTAPGEPCGNQEDTDCTAPDTCDGSGTCDPHHEPAGTPCGNPTPAPCSAADTCDGLGSCQSNNFPDDTPCDDGVYCTTGEVCTSGLCGGGSPTCDDSVDCTHNVCIEVDEVCEYVPDDDLCENGQYCDGVEVCDPIDNCVVSPGTVPNCDDGVDCTNDSCDEVDDMCVNDPDDGNCDNGDFCDGEEYCDPVANCAVTPGSVPNCNDGVDCTVDSCDEVDDVCVNDPDDDLCPDDGLYCNGPEICDAVSDCISGGCPCGSIENCDEETDSCLCEAPVVVAAGSRYLRIEIQPPDSMLPQAIVVTAYCAEGVPRYVGSPVPWDINGDGVPDGTLASLMDDPLDGVFLTPAEWGAPVYVTGTALVPETSYRVRMDCGTPGSPSLSDAAEPWPATWVWADTNQDDYANFADIQFMVFAFQHVYVPGMQTLPNLDIRGQYFCTPDQFSNFNDISGAVMAFQGQDYVDTGCPYDCPPCLPHVQCNDDNACTVDSCNPDGSCTNAIDYDEELWCCNPDDAGLTEIDDGDPCTVDVCNPATGRVIHAPIDCADGDDCTLDECVDGTCFNTPFGTIVCQNNSDCPEASPGCSGTHHCVCPGTPAALMEWQPVSSTGPYSIAGNEIVIPEGGVQVTVELMLSNWAPDEVAIFQGQILGDSSYVSGAAGYLSPLTDPDPSAGAFIVTKKCTPDGVNFYDPCEPGPPCPVGQYCASNPDFIFGYFDHLAVVNTSSGLNYFWGGLVLPPGPPAIDDGTRKYLGTLILEVSPDAKGTFTLELNPSINETLIAMPEGILIALLSLEPGLITIPTGKCCYRIGHANAGCADGLTEPGCDALPGPRAFVPGGTCSGDLELDCTGCTHAGDCNDHNACTTDFCDPYGICSSMADFDEASLCCNPHNGTTTLIDDSDPCTFDVCDEETGQVFHAPIEGCTPPVICAFEDEAHCKAPGDAYLLLSDRRLGVRWTDDFRPDGPEISQVCWWPCFYNLEGGEECFDTPPPDDFAIRFYEDAGGMPGAIVGPAGGELLVPDAKQWLGGNSRCWAYGASLPIAVSVTPGDCYWVEITGYGGDDGCAVFLLESLEGNAYSFLDQNGDYGVEDLEEHDLAICLDSGLASADDCGPVPGACAMCGQGCLDADDGMEHASCKAEGGIFFPDTDCAEVGWQPPANDDCADAIELTHPGGSPTNDIVVNYENWCATGDGPSPVPDCDTGEHVMGHDIWYTYVAPCSADVTADLCNNPAYDSMLVVYDGGAVCACPVDAGSQMACGDDTCGVVGGAAAVTIPAVAGHCYTIRVGGWGDEECATGTLQVSTTCAAVSR